MEKLPLNIHTTSRILEDYEQGWTLQGSSEWMALDPRNQGRKAVVNFWIPSHDPLSVAENLRAMNERYHEVASRQRRPARNGRAKKAEISDFQVH